MGQQSDITPSRTASRLLSALLVALWVVAAAAQSANTPLILPSSVAFDSSGNLYFAETGKHIVRRLSAAGVLTIVAGTGTQGYAGDGGPATLALLDSPTALAIDHNGNLFIADTHNHALRRVDALTGLISTYGVARLPVALAFSPQGALVFADAGTHQVYSAASADGIPVIVAGSGTQGFGGDGGLATAAMLDAPGGLAFDAAGNLLIADTHNHRVRRVDAVTGIITTVAGTGLQGFSGDQVAADASELALPKGLSFDGAGNLYVADSRNQRIRRIDAGTGLITTVAGDGTQGFLGDGVAATGASLDSPRSVAVSGAGLPVLADSGNGRVRGVDAAGTIQTVAGAGAVTPAKVASTTTLMQASAASLGVSVSGGPGTASGTVTLIDGVSPLGSAGLVNGAASFAMSLLSTGSHTLTAAYSGSSALLSSTSVPLLVTVGSAAAADFTLTAAAPASVTVPAGSAAQFSFGVGPTGSALSSPITLAVTGVPTGSTASFNPAVIPPLTGPAAFTLTIDTPASARMERWQSRRWMAWLAVGALCVPIALRRRRRGLWLAGLLLLAGCGARVNTGASTGPQAVSYNVTVTATATGTSGGVLLHTAQVTLIVD